MRESCILLPEIIFLIEAVASAPSADNSQPWCFDWDGNTLTCRLHQRGPIPSDYHATTLALGAAAENLIWASEVVGLDVSSWFLGPPNSDGVFAQGRVETAAAAKIRSLLDKPVWKRRHTNRLSYRLEIDPEAPLGLANCRVGEVRACAIEGRDIKSAADWVRVASEIRFQTREVNEWFAKSLRYGSSQEEMRDGLHVSTLALPPGGSGLLRLISSWKRLQVLNYMKAYKLFAAIEAVNFQKAPLVVAIVGPRDRASAFDAGRCLEQVWLKATERGLSAHPYYVVADMLNRLKFGGVPQRCIEQASFLKDCISAKFGPDRTLHCLLRVGKPVGNVPFSGRLPLNQVMCDTLDEG